MWWFLVEQSLKGGVRIGGRKTPKGHKGTDIKAGR